MSQIHDPEILALAVSGETEAWEGFTDDQVLFKTPCPECDKGMLYAPARFCPACSGNGWTTRQVTLSEDPIAEALAYAHAYWTHGNDPKVQAMLTVLAQALEAQTTTAQADALRSAADEIDAMHPTEAPKNSAIFLRKRADEIAPAKWEASAYDLLAGVQAPFCTEPCCAACNGKGADTSGSCSDCYGTGHAHPS